MPEERLQKILSRTGVASRRKAEELIVQGRVSVNGQTVDTLGAKADLENDHIKVDGQPLKAPAHHLYLALNKPKGCVTTTADPEGRETVMHLLRGVKGRVFPVGRLDYNSEGLLLFTNDGEFAHRVTAPENHVKKTYVVKANGVLTEDQENQFREGIPMHGRRTSPAELKRIKSGANPWYEVRITEGRQNQIRIMFKHFGKLVEKLRRVKVAFLELDVAPGRYRMLTAKEVERFQKLLKLGGVEEPPSDHEIRAGLAPKQKAKPAIVTPEAAAKPAMAAPQRPTKPRRTAGPKWAKTPPKVAANGPTRPPTAGPKRPIEPRTAGPRWATKPPTVAANGPNRPPTAGPKGPKKPFRTAGPRGATERRTSGPSTGGPKPVRPKRKFQSPRKPQR